MTISRMDRVKILVDKENLMYPNGETISGPDDEEIIAPETLKAGSMGHVDVLLDDSCLVAIYLDGSNNSACIGQVAVGYDEVERVDHD